MTMANKKIMRVTKKMSPISVRLEEVIRKSLDRIASEQDRSLSWIVNEACRRYIQTYTAKKNNNKNSN